MKKKLEKILEFIGLALIAGFGSMLLYYGFSFLFEALKVIVK
jgi:hypothetical protein